MKIVVHFEPHPTPIWHFNNAWIARPWSVMNWVEIALDHPDMFEDFKSLL